MSLKLGGSREKTKTKNTETFTKSTTPVLPDWLSSATEGFAGRINELGKIDPYSLVSPASALENRAGALAEGLTGSPWNFDRAADTMRGFTKAPAHQGEAQSLLTNLESYYNPYRQQVTDAAMADFDANAGATRAAQDLELAGAGAFGGSGAAITKSLTEGELSRARNTQLSKLLSDMFTTSAGLSGEDANRRQSASFENARLSAENDDRRMRAAQGLTDLSSAWDANMRANIASQADVGGTLRGISDARAKAPASLLTAQLGLFGDLPVELFRGETSAGNTQSTGTSTKTGFSVDAAGTWNGSGFSA
jgi:hypothetical protein